MKKRVSEEINTSFARAFTREEVEKALKQMGPLKSPGPNGFRAYFYQKYWNIVRDDACNAVLAILHGEGVISFTQLYFYYFDPKKM